MPVKLAQSTGLECHECSRNGLADREVCGIYLVEFASRSANLLRLMLEGTVDKRSVVVDVYVRLGSVCHFAVADSAVDNVRRRAWNILKHTLINAKVLGEDVFGRMSNPVINVESCAISGQLYLIRRLEERKGR